VDVSSSFAAGSGFEAVVIAGAVSGTAWVATGAGACTKVGSESMSKNQ
jgi:hypothetical protein